MTKAVLRPALIAAVLALGCGGGSAGSEPPKHGAIRDVVVVLKGGDEPLPFDPRGGRLTLVTQEISRLVGHSVIFELDTALSPDLKASLEETVLASFETIARELVLLQKEEPAMFAKARAFERVVCRYDAAAKESAGVLQDGGRTLVVRAPPDRFPLLERWVLTQAVYEAHVADLDERWGEVDPTRLAPREHAPYLAYMVKTRPGAGYEWVASRVTKGGTPRDELRAEHAERIVKLASVVEKKSPLARKLNAFLLESAPFVGSLAGGRWNVDPAVARRVAGGYEAWLGREVAVFDDDEKVRLERALFEGSGAEKSLPGFDRFAFGLAVYEAWAKEGARTDLPPGPRRQLIEKIVCPVKRRALDVAEAEREIRYGCSRYFAFVLGEEKERARLGKTIETRRDPKLLEMALLNLGHQQGAQALALLESFRDETLFRHGFAVLFHDLARRDDVRAVLEKAAPRWWRDAPDRRGLALLVMARQWEHLHVHYGDKQWTRFVAEFGGPIQRDVFAAYLAEGPRAIEMAPKIWPALEKGSERDELFARSLLVLLGRDREARSSRARPALVLLRARLCEEKNASALNTIRLLLDRWRADHPDDAAAVSNVIADFTLARCRKPSSEDEAGAGKR